MPNKTPKLTYDVLHTVADTCMHAYHACTHTWKYMDAYLEEHANIRTGTSMQYNVHARVHTCFWRDLAWRTRFEKVPHEAMNCFVCWISACCFLYSFTCAPPTGDGMGHGTE